eukprot:1017591-Pelagomonas_calceolata.AAC.1
MPPAGHVQEGLISIRWDSGSRNLLLCRTRFDCVRSLVPASLRHAHPSKEVYRHRSCRKRSARVKPLLHDQDTSWH